MDWIANNRFIKSREINRRLSYFVSRARLRLWSNITFVLMAKRFDAEDIQPTAAAQPYQST